MGEGGAGRQRHTCTERLPKESQVQNGKCCGMEVPGELGAECETRWEGHEEKKKSQI